MQFSRTFRTSLIGDYLVLACNCPFRNSKKDWVLVYTLLKLHLIKNITQPPEISLKGSKFTKFGLVLLHSNRPMSCQSSPKFHRNHSNSEIASLKSIQSL